MLIIENIDGEEVLGQLYNLHPELLNCLSVGSSLKDSDFPASLVKVIEATGDVRVYWFIDELVALYYPNIKMLTITYKNKPNDVF